MLNRKDINFLRYSEGNKDIYQSERIKIAPSLAYGCHDYFSKVEDSCVVGRCKLICLQKLDKKHLGGTSPAALIYRCLGILDFDALVLHESFVIVSECSIFCIFVTIE